MGDFNLSYDAPMHFVIVLKGLCFLSFLDDNLQYIFT